MIKKNMFRGLVVGLLAAMLFTGGMVVPVEAGDDVVAVEGETRAAVYTWYYKTINGKKYRRLYDETNEVWLTDWILCE